MSKKWVTFFSQTGSEILNISKSIGRKPDLIVTNNYGQTIPWNVGLAEMRVPILMAPHNFIMNYFSGDNPYHPIDTIITLHGYLRIIEPSVCTKRSEEHTSELQSH